MKPYRVSCANFLDFLVFLNLGLGALIRTFTDENDITIAKMVVPLWLPSVGLFCYLVYFITKHLTKICKKQDAITSSKNNENRIEDEAVRIEQPGNDDDDDIFAYRLQHPVDDDDDGEDS